jgi:hypothetical protein
MTILELCTLTENQANLLTMLVRDYAKELKKYPGDGYSLTSLERLEHCYNSLLNINDILTRPTKTELS